MWHICGVKTAKDLKMSFSQLIQDDIAPEMIKWLEQNIKMLAKKYSYQYAKIRPITIKTIKQYNQPTPALKCT